jgi:hypothetical protein
MPRPEAANVTRRAEALEITDANRRRRSTRL